MKHALSGRVVTMDPQRRIIEDGVVYLDDRTIAAACERGEPAPPGFEAITPLPARGTIFPGLIELHNHVSYNLLPLWQVDRKYTNRNQWSSTESYRAQVTGPMKVIGNTPELLPALARYVECKCLLAGVTTTQGVALFSNSGVRRYYRGLVRNVEQSLDDDLPAASARIADVEKADAERFHARLRKETCLLLHLSEGTDDAALSHFRELQLSSGWAITRALAGIHCVALGASHFEVIAKQGASMVWSPLSNLLLYGRTADVLAARKAGVRMGIGSDWSYTGSKNLLGELRVARACAAGRIPTRDLVAMATCEAAEILGWSRLLGSIEAGKRADLIVVAGSKGDPYDSLTTADERAIRLVVIDGIARCGTVSMMKALGVKGERIELGDSTRVIALQELRGETGIEGVSLRSAEKDLRRALGNLKELARRVEQRPSRPRGPGWRLELDDLVDPPVRWRDAIPLSELVRPSKLDPLAIAADETYWGRVRTQKNLPEAVRDTI